MKSTQRATAAASLVAAVGLGTFCVAIFGLVAGCTREPAPTKSAEEFDARKPTLQFGERRIEVLIACYKAILLTQEKYGGGVINSQSTGIAAALEPARRMIEQRLVGDLTEGAEKCGSTNGSRPVSMRSCGTSLTPRPKCYSTPRGAVPISRHAMPGALFQGDAPRPADVA